MATLLVDITPKCNLRCSHCYNSRYFNASDKFCFNKFTSVIENNEFKRVHLLGGEPLLANNFFRILDYLEKSKITISINSNGTLFTEEVVEKLSKYKLLDQITISIDGHDSKTNDAIRGLGVFNKVAENIKLITKRLIGVSINLAFVITPNNMESIKYIGDTALNLGIENIFLSFLYYQGNAAKTEIKYDYDRLVDYIVISMKKCCLNGVKITLDAKPIFLTLIEILSYGKISFRYDVSNMKCYVNQGNLYMSANNKVFPCGPSSFFGGKYRIDKIVDFNDFNERKIKLCNNCHFSNVCSPCPLNIKCGNEFLCHYAVERMEIMFQDIMKLKISKSCDYKLVVYNSKLILINFRENIIMEICEHLGNEFNYDMTLSDILELEKIKDTNKSNFIVGFLKLYYTELAEFV